MSSDDKARQVAILQKTPGPAPWYWETFPRVAGRSGQRFAWTHHGDKGDLAYLVTLALEQEPEAPRLALNTYCVPFAMAPHRLGVWCPDGRRIRVMCFELDQLAAFRFEEIAGWFKRSTERVYSATAPVAEFDIPRQLQAGTHKIELPETFRSLDELITVTSYPAATKDDPAFAVFVLYPQAGLVEVLPQDWITTNTLDVGYQWITRVTRDPHTQHLIGDGIRIGKFALAEDGRKLDHWIDPTI
jgi:hypothetical protein